jgi:hypothetical protein
MLTVVRLAMLCFAVMIGVAIGIGLHALMPQVSIWAALWYFFVLGLAFLFACTLVIASLMIGSAPGRSKLGQQLNAKVNQQTEGSGELYEQARRIAAKRNQAEPETTMRPPQAK